MLLALMFCLNKQYLLTFLCYLVFTVIYTLLFVTIKDVRSTKTIIIFCYSSLQEHRKYEKKDWGKSDLQSIEILKSNNYGSTLVNEQRTIDASV